MRKILKKIGRFFIILSQKNEEDIRQSVLLVDGSFILPNIFALIIKGVQKKFKNAKISALAFKDKEEFIRNNFPGIEIIVPETKIKIIRYQLAVQLLFLLRKKPHFIILSSLDISTTFVSLIFAKCPVFLHNRWLEWYRLRQKDLSDIFKGVKSADRNRRKKSRGIKDIIKNLGRCFVILSALNEEDTKTRILVEDNGYTDTGHTLTAVRRADEVFINADITILTFAERKQHFVNMFPHMKLIIVEESDNRYRLAIRMYRMRKYRFDYIILTALDISPIVISFLFFKAKVLLYNRWHQWWSLDLRNVWGYFKYILIFLATIPVFIYLLITTSLILFRTGFRLRLMNLKSSIVNRNKNESGY